MQGDQRHALRVAIKGILISHERGVFDKSVECVERGELHESPRDTAKFQEVRPALLPLHTFRCEVRAQARFGVDAIQQLRKRDRRNAITESANYIGNTGKGVACARVHARDLTTSSGGDDVPVWGSIGRTNARRCSCAQ